MPIVPFAPQRQSRPTMKPPPDVYLMMAAAQMHSEGRLVQDIPATTRGGESTTPPPAEPPKSYFPSNGDRTGPSMMTREDDIVPALTAGIMNNNPGNIKYDPDIKWEGQVGPSRNKDQGSPQAVFASQDQGMRALSRQIDTMASNGASTIKQFAAQYTPTNPQAADNIARNMGVSKDSRLDLTDPEVQKKLIPALLLQEHGDAASFYTAEAIEKGIRLNKSSRRSRTQTATLQPAM